MSKYVVGIVDGDGDLTLEIVEANSQFLAAKKVADDFDLFDGMPEEDDEDYDESEWPDSLETLQSFAREQDYTISVLVLP